MKLGKRSNKNKARIPSPVPSSTTMSREEREMADQINFIPNEMINYELTRLGLPHNSTKRVRNTTLATCLVRPDVESLGVLPHINVPKNLDLCEKYFSDFESEFRSDIHSTRPLSELLAKVLFYHHD